MRNEGISIPVVGSAYILSAPVARAFNAGKVAGCVVSDDLLAVAEQQAKAADKGRAFFLELAAKQLVVARGIGMAGVYIAGQRDAGEIARILEMADAHPADDWRSLLPDVSWPEPDTFSPFASDGAGLNTDELDAAYATSLTPAGRKQLRGRTPFFYKVSRVVHARAFEPGTGGFNAWKRVYGKIDSGRLDKPVHVFEQAVKAPLYDCRDCGDCSLPDIAYLCPESHCQKNQRNGPCGGGTDGQCEIPGHTCIWADAYTRLKAYGEERAMLDRAPVFQDNELRRTSAWGNAFLGRDHIAKRLAAEAADAAAGTIEAEVGATATAAKETKA